MAPYPRITASNASKHKCLQAFPQREQSAPQMNFSQSTTKRRSQRPRSEDMGPQARGLRCRQRRSFPSSNGIVRPCREWQKTQRNNDLEQFEKEMYFSMFNFPLGLQSPRVGSIYRVFYLTCPIQTFVFLDLQTAPELRKWARLHKPMFRNCVSKHPVGPISTEKEAKAGAHSRFWKRQKGQRYPATLCVFLNLAGEIAFSIQLQ